MPHIKQNIGSFYYLLSFYSPCYLPLTLALKCTFLRVIKETYQVESLFFSLFHIISPSLSLSYFLPLLLPSSSLFPLTINLYYFFFSAKENDTCISHNALPILFHHASSSHAYAPSRNDWGLNSLPFVLNRLGLNALHFVLNRLGLNSPFCP